MATPYNAPLSGDFTNASAAGGARAPDPWDAPPYNGDINTWMAAEVRSGRNFSSWLQNPEVAQAYQQYRSGVDQQQAARMASPEYQQMVAGANAQRSMDQQNALRAQQEAAAPTGTEE